ncbi:hypothetical protein DFH08DRAFT_971356 [Mycena albidolilacea]|uniref:Ig-like domain-containing protein n=1 Tax=Mycena albidolilacea TaxID=1033008 RepID=A0AAD6ZDK9_9AGAR|nr:hypothetical protein DFH08DRAFT_971356 [Mycena albidolilacea]
MSNTDASRSFLDGAPFATFNTPGDTRSGVDQFFSAPDLFNFLPPPYCLTDADVFPTPGCPFLTVHPDEIGFSTIQVSEDCWKALDFLAHPAIYRLLPFARVPERIRRMDPGYLATILDRAVPVFETLHRAYPLVPHTQTFMTLLAALVHMVLVVRELVPARAQDKWFAFLPEGESTHSAHWDMYPPLSFGNNPFVTLSSSPTTLRIARPTLHALAAFLAKGKVYDDTDVDRVVQLFDDAIAPENGVFRAIANEYRAGRLSAHIMHAFFNSIRDLVDYLPADRRNPAWTIDLIPMDPASASLLIPVWFAILRGLHEDSLEEPYPVQGMSAFDSVWHWWRRVQAGYSQPTAISPPRRSGSAGSPAGTYSPHYEPSTTPERSTTPILRPASPPAQLGPSAVGSASFDIRQLLGSAKKDLPTPRKVSAIAASPESPTEMQVDPPEMSSADAIAIAEALNDLPPRRGPPRTAARGKQTSRRSAPSVHPAPTGVHDKQGRPMIVIKLSQRSITPPASEAYNEEGKEEKEEEEEEEVPPRPAKRRRTAPTLPKSKTPGKSMGKGKVQVETPALVDTSSTFPIPVHKTHGKSKKAEMPAYVPPQPVLLMDTVSLAAETLASQRCEPLVFDTGCSNCIFRDRKCDHGAPRTLCEHCDKGCLSHCSHNFSVADHARAANHLEPYARLSNERGNELITDLSAARADYELAREQLFRASARIAVVSNHVSTWIRGVISNLGVYGLPRITEIPEALRPLWGQLLADAEVDLSVNYRAAIQRYPFISDTRWADLPSDEDLPILIEFLTCRAAHAHRPTPPPEELNWPDEGEAGPSGSK